MKSFLGLVFLSIGWFVVGLVVLGFIIFILMGLTDGGNATENYRTMLDVIGFISLPMMIPLFGSAVFILIGLALRRK